MSNPAINTAAAPSGEGCLECEQTDGWWLHLRRCAECGHVGCCDNSPSQHGTAHFTETGHAIMQSFEPGENWFWNYETEQMLNGPRLAEPTSRPASQAVPGPEGRVPSDWRSKLNP
ncbi:UBP-type zinc finger domain-containing protein [Conyzicola nivalis]|uniref:UBP-type domain-containing protein n=1 Tax=Conyzicola nivalis TaxID=1477021 RepID=A0A916SAK1_9MICO|nr:UBP-type zinc finger domain-containing protein [Conyzicola nivalis]GGA90769.1 hypothetical protein GCM10010979_01840 [Conyzicola nivalis]